MRGASDILQTERLQLRWLTVDDAPLMLAVWNDPAFVQHVGDRGVRTEEQARQSLEDGALKLYGDHGYGPYSVTTHADSQPIGVCGLFKRDNLEDPDIGFGLLPEYCRKGYALEASLAVVAHARDDMQLQRLTAIVSPGNRPSIQLIEKLGLCYERDLRMPGEDHDVSLYAVEW